ncbi:MAG: hypothetical protein JW809_13070 [Pirellulales bacterium]|nr:hypothetical protein [Pirellulales bacterium]
MESRHSIVAEISQQIDLFGHQFAGKGQYREERTGPQPKVRLELKIPLDETGTKIGTLVQVCDGRYLWTYRRLLDDGKLSRVDLDRVAKAAGQGGEAACPAALMGPIGAGGLPGLMEALRRQFTFELIGESTLTRMPVWQLRGTWRPDRLARLLPDQKDAVRQGRGVDLAALPPHLPDHVVLLLGKEDFFPYRFEYRRAVAGTNESRALVTMTLPSVNVNVPIDPSHFQYGATELEPSDETQQFIQSRLGARVGGRR